MTNSARIALIAAALVLLAGGSEYAVKMKAASDAAKAVREQEASCAHYLDDKNAYFVKECLDKHQLGARVAEAKALLANLSRARSDAVGKLEHTDPALLAMMKKWVAAKADDPALSFRVKISHGDGDLFPSGEMHGSTIDQQKILSDMSSFMHDKLPPGMDFEAGDGCAVRSDDLNIEATYTVHETGDTSMLEYGSKTTMVRTLAYNVDVVACYQGEHASVASVKDRAMPLRQGYSVESDPSSVQTLAQQEMDRGAEALIGTTIRVALGMY